MEIFGPFGEPAFVVLYGVTGIGKSMDALRAFPGAYWLGLPGSAKPALELIGLRFPVEQQVQVANLAQVVTALRMIHAGDVPWRPAAIVDDVSLLAQASDLAYPESGDGFGKWRNLGRLIKEIRDYARQLKMHVVFTAHEKSANQERGRPGGPHMPSYTMQKDLVHAADVVYRVVKEPGRVPWPVVYDAGPPSPMWDWKDRHGVAKGRVPLNLGEILRSVGMVVPRLPGLAWQDEIAEQIAVQVLDLPEAERIDLASRVLRELTHTHHIYEGHAYWAVSDGLDRADLRRRKGFASLFARPTPLGGLLKPADKPAVAADVTTTGSIPMSKE